MSIGRITLDALEIVELESNPTVAPGLTAPIGSLGLMDNGTGLYYKSGPSNTDWIILKNVSIDMFNGTQRFTEKLRFYNVSLSTASDGVLTVHPTSTGLNTGTALFSQILGYYVTPTFVAGDVFRAPFFVHNSTAADLRTVTFHGFRGRSQGILLGGVVQTLERAPDNIQCKVTIVGIGV